MAFLSLALHILAGFTALLSGCVAICSKKGTKWHITAGRIFVWSMEVVVITALHLSIVRPNTFLLLIAIFSFYLAWSGFRAIHWKNMKQNRLVFIFDTFLTSCMILTGLIMIGIPVAAWAGTDLPAGLIQFGTILLVFGIINTLFAGFDLINKFYSLSNNRFWWLYQHIGRMGGAYIATFTAFLVVNVTFLSDLVVWLGPTIIGSPLIAHWIRKYRKEMEKTRISAG